MHRAVITLAFALICATDAPAAEVKILTAGAMKAVVLELVPQFEKETGHKAVIDNDTAGGLAKRIEGREVFDAVVVTPGVIDDLANKERSSPTPAPTWRASASASSSRKALRCPT